MARAQHWVLTRADLEELGFSKMAVEHRISTGRLHLVARGIYAVGRRELTQHGRWMAAVLACGDGAVLSHRSAAELWGIEADLEALAARLDMVGELEGDLRDIDLRRRRLIGGLNDPCLRGGCGGLLGGIGIGGDGCIVGLLGSVGSFRA